MERWNRVGWLYSRILAIANRDTLDESKAKHPASPCKRMSFSHAFSFPWLVTSYQ